MPTLEKPRLERFAQLLASGHSETDAYRLSGHKAQDAKSRAASLAGTPAIRLRVAEIVASQAAFVAEATGKPVPSKEWVIHELLDLLEVCMGRKPVRQSVVVRRRNEPPIVHHVAVTLYDAPTAFKVLELLGKDLGMAPERVEIGGPGAFKDL